MQNAVFIKDFIFNIWCVICSGNNHSQEFVITGNNSNDSYSSLQSSFNSATLEGFWFVNNRD